MLPYSPLHHLLLEDSGAPLVMTSANVSDEPIAYRDEDALERLAGRSRTCSSCTTGRSRLGPMIPCFAWLGIAPLFLRRSRGYVPRRPAARRRRGRSLACGAELKIHLLCREGRIGPGSAITSGTCRTTRPCAPSREGIEHFERLFAVGPSWSPTTCIRNTSRRSTRSSARESRPSASSTITPISRPAWRSTARRARRSERSSMGPAWAPTGRSGAASSSPATRAASSAPDTCTRSACREESAPFASPGGWPAPGCSTPPVVSRPSLRSSPARSPRMPGGRWRSWRRAAWRHR